MAKSPKNRSRSEVAESKLREFHALGQSMLEATSAAEQGKYAPGIIKDQAAITGRSRQHIYTARRFAKLYTTVELNGLCALRMPDGKPLGIGHISQLIRV